MSDVLNGIRVNLPDWRFVHEFVPACRAAASESGLDANELDVFNRRESIEFLRRWTRDPAKSFMRSETSQITPSNHDFAVPWPPDAEFHRRHSACRRLDAAMCYACSRRRGRSQKW
jgi:hypothetical protein